MNKYASIFQQVITDPDYYLNIVWGKPRRGHPEGSIAAHIVQMDFLLDARYKKLIRECDGTLEDQYWQLRTFIHVHDTFKAKAMSGSNVEQDTNHGKMARNFLARYTDDTTMLNIVHYHDEGYNMWKAEQRGVDITERFEKLIKNTQSHPRLFLIFVIIDATTPGKGREALMWFVDKYKKYWKETYGEHSPVESITEDMIKDWGDEN